MEPREVFKKIRNQLAKCDLPSLVLAASSKIHWAETKEPGQLQGWLPWRLLLLIKWGYEYGGTHYPTKPVNENLLIKLMNLVHEFEGSTTSPFLEQNTVEGLHKFLRTIAFQQFWLQYRLGTWEIARQHILFCRLPDEHPIPKQFRALFGLSMLQFLELAMLLWSWLAKDPANITFSPRTLFSNIHYSDQELEQFLHLISLPLRDTNRFLKERRQAVTNPYLQLTEKSPFTRHPVVQINDQYLVYSRRVFEATIGDLFYDVMKSHLGITFANQFATLLEHYVDTGLSHVYTKYYSEKDLLRLFPRTKVTDFLIPFEDCTVMIEVKAAEIRPTIQVYPESDRLVKELRDSIVKAVIQAFSLSQSLANSSAVEIPCKSVFFLLIVTYRQMYLGPGEQLWNEFLRDAVLPEIHERGLSEDLLPPANIVVMSIDEFEQLTSVLIGAPGILPLILNEMVKDNADFSTQKLLFSQHVEKRIRPDAGIPYLDAEFRSLSEGVLERFRHRTN